MNLLPTRLHLPALPARRIQRPRLVQRLNEGLAAGRPLTLISAPAGFGKSTCASEWVNSLRLPAVWLALEAQDDNPERFFACFIAALQQVDPSIGREIESALQSGQLPPFEVVIAALASEILAAARRFVLVLDDFHIIQDTRILQALEKLATSLAGQMHLVLVTREDPLLPLARLRAHNQLTELRSADLRFSTPEIERFLNEMMSLSLSEADVAALQDRTEGWVVGLQLAALSMQGRADPAAFIASLSGTHRYFLGYLTEEVLSRQPLEIQDFLLQTSILEKLNGSLCDAVSGRSDSLTLLEDLYNANLFLIPLDDEQRWYRYHHLFADLLRNQLLRSQKENVPLLHRRASAWYEQAGQPAEAVEHALAAADYPRVVRLVEAHAMRMVMQGYAKTVEGWLQAIPPEMQSHSPKTHLAFAWMHLLRGSYDRIAPYLTLVESALEEDENTAALRAEWHALRSNLLNVQGRAEESIAQAKLALQLAHPQDQYVHAVAYLGMGGAHRLLGDYGALVQAYQKAIQASRMVGNYLGEMIAASALTLMAIQQGQLHFAYEIGTQVIERIERDGNWLPPTAGTVIGVLGVILYQWNDLEKARAQFLRSLHMSALGGHNAGLVYNQVHLSRLALAGGDLAAASRAIQEAHSLLPLGAPAWVIPEVISQQVNLLLAQDNPAAAAALLAQSGMPIDEGEPLPRRLTYPQEILALAGLRLLLYRGQQLRQPRDLKRGMDLASRLITGAVSGGRTGIVLQTLLLRALMQSALAENPETGDLAPLESVEGGADAALDDLCQALKLAEPEGYIRLFVDEGAAAAALLERSLQRQVSLAYVKKLLSAFPAAPASKPPSFLADVPIEPLSERELEVLRLMADGLKYEEIAARLVISLNTVRFHVKAIYHKFNTNNRTKAIDLARRLGMLPLT